MNIAYLVIFLGFYGILFLILFIVRMLTKRLKLPNRAKNIVFIMSVLFVFLIANYLREPWYNLFEEKGIWEVITDKGVVATAAYNFEIDGNGLVVKPSAKSKNNNKKVIAGSVIRLSTYKIIKNEQNKGAIESFKKEFDEYPLKEVNIRNHLNRSFAVLPILILAYFINILISFFLWYGTLVDEDGEPVVPALIRQVTSVLIYLIAVAIIIQIIAPNSLNTFLATVGTSGAVAAFLAQEPIKQAFTALSLNITKRVKRGDFIELNGYQGWVEEIGWKSIRLTTRYEGQLSIPNNILVNNIYYNHSRPKNHRYFAINVTVIENVSPGKVIQLLKKAAWDTGYLSQDPRVTILELTEYRAVYQLEIWTQEEQVEIVRGAVLSVIWYMMRREKIHPIPAEEVLKDATAAAEKIFRNVDIFKPLSEEEKNTLAQGAEWRRYGAGERIVMQGETDASLYIVSEGELEVFVLSPKKFEDFNTQNVSLETRELGVSVATLKKNQLFGETALLTGEPRGASVKANTEVLLCRISKEIIQPVLTNRPEVMQTLSEMIAKKQMENDKTLGDKDKANLDAHQQSLTKKLYSLMQRFLSQ